MFSQFDQLTGCRTANTVVTLCVMVAIGHVAAEAHEKRARQGLSRHIMNHDIQSEHNSLEPR